MASPNQILANRQNSIKSTGARTLSGTRASSLNAIRHGLTSQRVLLPGEDHQPYEAFRANLMADLSPSGTIETMLAQNLCDTQWRLERARKLESNLLAIQQFDEIPHCLYDAKNQADREALIEAYAAHKYDVTLRNIQIQEARLQRSLIQTLRELREMQASRRATKPAPPPEAAPLPTKLASFLESPKPSAKSVPPSPESAPHISATPAPLTKTAT